MRPAMVLQEVAAYRRSPHVGAVRLREGGEPRIRERCLLVASAGGHLDQLYEIGAGSSQERRTWVTFDTSHAASLLVGERVVYAHHPTNRNARNLLRNALLAVRIVRRERPSVMITTGAGVAVPFAYAARMFRVP